MLASSGCCFYWHCSLLVWEALEALDTIAAGNKPGLGAAEATIVVVVKSWLVLFITVLVFRIAPAPRFSNSSNVERGAM